MRINEISKEIHKQNVEKGFWDDKFDPKKIPVALGLIHSEVSEAMEADRKAQFCGIEKAGTLNLIQNDEIFEREFRAQIKDHYEDELADIMIRVMDLAAAYEINLEEHIKAKMRFNSMREYKHGKKY